MTPDERRTEIARYERLIAEAARERIDYINKLAAIESHLNHLRHRLGAQKIYLALAEREEK